MSSWGSCTTTSGWKGLLDPGETPREGRDQIIIVKFGRNYLLIRIGWTDTTHSSSSCRSKLKFVLRAVAGWMDF